MELRTILVLLLSVFTQSAIAADISFTLTQHGGNTWEYTYTVTNTGDPGPGTNIQWFSLDFDPVLYDEASLTVTSPAAINADWDQNIFPSGPGLDAVYDVFALAGGIPPGESQTGFSIRFDWIGPAAPGAQPFAVYDPATAGLLFQGNTNSGSAISIPVFNGLAGGLLLLGLILLAMLRLRRRTAVAGVGCTLPLPPNSALDKEV